MQETTSSIFAGVIDLQILTISSRGTDGVSIILAISFESFAIACSAPSRTIP